MTTNHQTTVLTGNGLKLSEEAEIYARFPPFSNENKTLIVGFTLRTENIDFYCQFYLMLFSEEWRYFLAYSLILNGYQYSRVNLNATFGLKDWLEHELKAGQSMKHQIVLRPNNSYSILIDDKKVHNGSFNDFVGITKQDLDKPMPYSPMSYKNSNIHKIGIRFEKLETNERNPINLTQSITIDDISVMTIYSKG